MKSIGHKVTWEESSMPLQEYAIKHGYKVNESMLFKIGKKRFIKFIIRDYRVSREFKVWRWTFQLCERTPIDERLR